MPPKTACLESVNFLCLNYLRWDETEAKCYKQILEKEIEIAPKIPLNQTFIFVIMKVILVVWTFSKELSLQSLTESQKVEAYK